MQQNYEIAPHLERINRMETYFDAVCSAMDSDSVFTREQLLREAAHALTEYMASGAWLEDYRLDEKGIIPPEIKRGVLSQDGLYNVMGELSDLYK